MVRPGYESFLYSPALQGFDESTWRINYGTLNVASGYLQVSEAELQLYTSMYRGKASFIVNVPQAGAPRTIGLFNYSEGSYAYFNWAADGNLYGKVRNASHPDTVGVTASSPDTTNSTIAWDSNWYGNDIAMDILWEAGSVTFFINGTKVAWVSESSTNTWSSGYPNNIVPTTPLSVFIANQDSDTLRIKSISLTGASYLVTPDNPEGQIYQQDFVFRGDNISVSENISFFWDNWVPENYEAVAVAENVTLSIS